MSEQIEDLIDEILSAPESFDKYIQELKMRRTRIREWKERDGDLIRMCEETFSLDNASLLFSLSGECRTRSWDAGPGRKDHQHGTYSLDEFV